MTATGCEGRCGSRLTPEGRERGILVPQPGDWAPFHTPKRCRAIRALRDAIVDRCPAALVDIYPDRDQSVALTLGGRIIVHVSEGDGDQLRTVSRVFRDEWATETNMDVFTAARVMADPISIALRMGVRETR